MKRKIIALLLVVMFSVILSGCNVNRAELISYANSNDTVYLNIDTDDVKYNQAFLDFTAELFKNIDEGDNRLLSPLSIYLALSMLTNGARDNTLSELESVLGMLNYELNSYCYYLATQLENKDAKAIIANSIWINNDSPFSADTNFLNTNAMYYKAEIYRDAFSHKRAVKNINAWVNNNTQGLISKITDSIDPLTVMMLINTLYFDSKWQREYNSYTKYPFNSDNGQTNSVDFFLDTQQGYYSSDNAKAFKVSLKDDYYFLGILPDVNDIDNYMTLFDGNELYSLINNFNLMEVKIRIPKFSYDYSINLNQSLSSMGIIDAFDPYNARFGGLGVINDNLYVSDVIHKTTIELTRGGVKAAAVTKIGMKATSAPHSDSLIELYLDRPFIYAIMNGKTDTPLFIGSVKNL